MASTTAPEFRGAYGRHWPAAALAIALLLNVSALASAFESSTRLTPWTGGEKPAFTLDDVERRKVALSAPGKVVLVHFFATWCEACREELPALERLVQRSDSRRVEVLAISVAEPDSRVRAFIDNLQVNFPVLLDRDRTIAKSWGVYALPTTFVLDGTLKPRLFIESDYDWDKFDVSDFLKPGAIPDPPLKPASPTTE